MRLFLLLFILATSGAHAQVLRGVVVDGSTGRPLFPVNITNVTNLTNATTDEKGNFSIVARSGDQLSFSFVGYNTIRKTAIVENNIFKVELDPLNVELKEYVVHRGLSDFQKDSVEMSELYSKTLNTHRTKPTFGTTGDGVGVSGLIGSIFEKHSRVYKRNKRFKENFLKDEEQKFIDTRYTPKLVATLTNLRDDTLVMFMNRYPMEYSFARTATDLEMKMWVRSNYRDYLHQNKDVK